MKIRVRYEIGYHQHPGAMVYRGYRCDIGVPPVPAPMDSAPGNHASQSGSKVAIGRRVRR